MTQGFQAKACMTPRQILERRYKKTLLLINSGSGYSDDPLVVAEDLAKYIEDKKTNKFSMGLFTSAMESPLGEICGKYGNVVELKGRGNPSLALSTAKQA